MSTPPFLPLDRDVLLQVLVTKYAPLLKKIKQLYGLEPAIVPEVEYEFESHSKRLGVFDQAVKKAIESGSLRLLDEDAISQQLARTGMAPQLASDTLDQLAETGELYNRHVHRGEAYTFAIATGLGLPAASNDREALNTLVKAGLRVPEPTLRFFDLVVFGLQTGILEMNECEQIRKRLMGAKEGLPGPFQHKSFEDGLRDFKPRLIDSSRPLCCPAPVASPVYAKALILEGPLRS